MPPQSPHAANLRNGQKMGDLGFVDTMIKDGLWDAFHGYHMGQTAENIAARWQITREDQDRFAVGSQNRAEAAQKSGRFKDEIAPVTVKTRKGDVVVDTDEYPKHGATLDAYIDRVKAAAFLATDRPNALRQAIHCCRKGGVVSIPGVYGGFLDKIPFGAAFQKGLTFKMGQTHMMRYMKPLLDRIESGELDPSFVITHRVPLDNAPDAYKIFRDHQEGCIKVVLNPHPETVH